MEHRQLTYFLIAVIKFLAIDFCSNPGPTSHYAGVTVFLVVEFF